MAALLCVVVPYVDPLAKTISAAAAGSRGQPLITSCRSADRDGGRSTEHDRIWLPSLSRAPFPPVDGNAGRATTSADSPPCLSRTHPPTASSPPEANPPHGRRGCIQNTLDESVIPAFDRAATWAELHHRSNPHRSGAWASMTVLGESPWSSRGVGSWNRSIGPGGVSGSRDTTTRADLLVVGLLWRGSDRVVERGFRWRGSPGGWARPVALLEGHLRRRSNRP
jgi:hypothetical protein